MSLIPVEEPGDNVQAHPSQEPYEAPRVETVLTPEEMERELHYAGVIGSDTEGPG